MRRVILAIVSTAAALVFVLSFKAHSTSALATPAPSAVGATPASRASASTSTPAAGKSPTAGSKASGSKASASKALVSPAPASPAKTVTGATADTMYGPVQVQVTVKNGKVTAAKAVVYPSQDPRDAQINSYAIPVLNSEAVTAGSAQIDTVSGATYTSNGYITSLQSALDQARQ